jgi:hypothetical protein
MDGLPGLRRGVETAKKENVQPIKKMVGPYGLLVSQMRRQRANIVPVWYLVIVAVLSFCLGVVATVLVPSRIPSLHG